MELEKEKLNSEKLYRIGYSLKLNKYILAITIPYHIWYERYYEITLEEYNTFGSKELDMLKEQLIVQGTKSERFVFSEFDSENTRKQRAIKNKAR